MLTLIQLSVAFACMLMFFMTRPQKLALLMVVCILCSEVSLEFIPIFQQPTMFAILMLLLSEFGSYGRDISALSKTILTPFLLISFVAFFIHYFTSPHYHTEFKQFIRLFLVDELGYYMVPAYGYICLKNESSMPSIAKWVNRALFVLTVFAVINFVTQVAFMIDLLGTHKEAFADSELTAGSKFFGAERFRVQALFFNPFDYGYICIALFIFNLFCFFKGYQKKWISYAAFGCCFFGVLTCGSRTVIGCFVLAFCIFYLIAFSFKKTFRYLVFFFLCFTVAYMYVPFITEKVDQTLSIIDPTRTKVEGSTLSMREGQYAAVLYHIRNHETFGRGKDYFNIDLGWAKGGLTTVHDTRLWGLEGVHLRYLLEHGIVGYVLYLVTFLMLLIFFLRHKERNDMTSSIGITMLLTYLSFAHLTGELKSPIPTFLILGMMIKLIYLRDGYRKQISSSSNVERKLFSKR